jgi:hypothetical protein
VPAQPLGVVEKEEEEEEEEDVIKERKRKRSVEGDCSIRGRDARSAWAGLGGRARTSALGCDFLDQLLHVHFVDALLPNDL